MSSSESQQPDEISVEEESNGYVWQTLFYGGGLTVAVGLWLSVVCREVKGVYLDEEFHVRQSLVYFSNQFSVWDPKITTPPGLYLASYPWLHLLRLLGIKASFETQLRALNAVGLLAVFWTAWGVADAIRSERQTNRRRPNSSSKSTTVLTALNVAIFPPLFFFSALFYTDVLSALVVLMAHSAFYRRSHAETLLWSLASLWFRQTNIFWTGVYLGGLETVRTLQELSEKRKTGQRAKAKDQPEAKRKSQTHPSDSWTDIVQRSWTDVEVYDVDAPTASIDDYIKTAISLFLAALSNLPHLIIPLLLHLLTIASFAGFILWNGSVVLGDKTNHTATLHLPQMLYLWPCFTFFSFPHLLSNFMNWTLFHLSLLLPTSAPEPLFTRSALYRPPLWLGATFLATLAVRFNTIVHPFLLADNRHFTFYVFRQLTRNWLVKYAAAGVYVTCGWACLSAGAAERKAEMEAEAEVKVEAGAEAEAVAESKSKLDGAPPAQGSSPPALAGSCARTSHVLLWLLVTAASLVTAPLVEPRYFILPWVFWTLNLPEAPEKAGGDGGGEEESEEEGARERGAGDNADPDSPPPSVPVQTAQLYAAVARAAPDLQTNWLALVNLAVGYVFLFWTFEWPRNPGEVMRFMW